MTHAGGFMRRPHLSVVWFGVTDMERPDASELADDGLPLSDIDPQTGWMYGEVGA